MKKLIAFIAAAMISTAGFSATGKSVVPDYIIASFQSTYKQAADVKWEETNKFYKAEFQQFGQYLTAYFGEDGAFLGVSKNILSSQLPLLLQFDVKKNYSNYWITDLFELADQYDQTYYITLENGNETLILKSEGTEWVTFKKIAKN